MEPTRETGQGHATDTGPDLRTFPPPRTAVLNAATDDVGRAADGVTPPALPTPTDTEPARPWSPWSVAVLCLTGLILVGALLLHVGMVFLTLAPDNAVSERHEDTIKAYVQPQFRQNWRLFAPNPMQRDDAIGARVRIGDGARTSEWINVTAMDIASIRHSLAPSHVSHNMLRKGWQAYVDSHDDDEEATDGEYSYVIAAYVKRIVLQRIGREWHGEPITAVQIAGRFTRVTPPSWSDEEKPRTTAYRVLPWWNVSDQDYRGL